MKLSSLYGYWRDFWFAPEGTLTIGIYRILYGILILQIALVHLNGRFSEWYGNQAVIPLPTVIKHFWYNEPRFDLFLLFPQTEPTFTIFYFVLVLSAFCLTFGLFSNFSAMLVWLLLLSMHHQDPYNINGGDAFLRAVGPFLALSHCGDHFSLDAIIDKKRGITRPERRAPWAQRLIQVQLALVYWQTFVCKVSGGQWLDGTAVYYATRLDDMLRFPLPLVSDYRPMFTMATWFTLIIEFFGFTLIFVKECKYFVVIGLIALHLGIEYMINLPVFEWAFIFALFTFVESNHVQILLNWAKFALTPKPVLHEV
ncbi:MAG: HTTM domain-containing protein [Candidatus Obscuribacter sp.]|nr:HTTM domain-containing protein [Candidatus Obscuribacter sp.]